MTVFRHRVQGPGSAGDVWVSTLHTSGIASLNSAHAAWSTFITNVLGGTLAAMWAPSTQARTLITDQLDDVSWRNSAQVTSDINIVGSSAGKAVSPDNCMVIGLRTDLPTRGGRGRMFLPSPSADHYNAAGRFLPADCSAVADEFSVALDIMKNTVQPVIAHRTSHQTTLITRVTVGDIAGIQRRRSNKATVNYASSYL